MIILDRNKLKELLLKTFDEGCCGYVEFKDGFVEQVLDEAQAASATFSEKNTKAPYSIPAAPNNYTVTVDTRSTNYSATMLRDLYGIGAGGGGTGGYGATGGTGRYAGTGGAGGTGNWGGSGSVEGWTVASGGGGAAGSNGQIYINYN